MTSGGLIPPHDLQYVTTRPVLEARRALTQASKSGDLEKVISLVNEWPRRHWDPQYLEFGLFSAFDANQLQVARYLLSCGAQVEDIVLHSAVTSRSLPAFELMVEYGWNVNTPTIEGLTALGLVVEDESLVRWFLDHGANPNLGPPPFQSVLPVIPSLHSGYTLNAVAFRSTVDVLNLLLAHGAKLENSLALHAAAQAREDHRRIPMMERLLELGMDINGSDVMRGPRQYGTPLDCAIRYGRKERVRFLKERGAISRRTSWGIDSIILDNTPSTNSPPEMTGTNTPSTSSPSDMIDTNTPSTNSPPDMTDTNTPSTSSPSNMIDTNTPSTNGPPDMIDMNTPSSTYTLNTNMNTPASGSLSDIDNMHTSSNNNSPDTIDMKTPSSSTYEHEYSDL